jgi:UDP-N-acetylmuramate--alanine ligase
MSALARLAMARGIRVSGSSDTSSGMTRRLQEEGARLMIGHRAEHVGEATRVVVTSAVSDGNPELLAAHALGLPVLRRGELLAEFFNVNRGIAIAGTHGKTTVTAMVATILEHAGFDPTVAVGGERRETGTNYRSGKSEWFVSEADESDGSFLALRPHVAVVTNIENDHILSDEGIAGLIAQFRTFLQGVAAGGFVLLSADESYTAALLQAPSAARMVTYGLTPGARYRAIDRTYQGFASRCTVLREGESCGELRIAVPGEINVRNALAATAVALELGIPFAVIAKALALFGGVRRRFDILLDDPRMVVIDDYAHHPTAVEATIAAARGAHDGPLIVAFQAHRYTRTRYLAEDFARALTGADAVILPELYAASEAPIEGVDERSIGEPLRRAGVDVAYVSRAELASHLLATAPSGAMVLMLGAGDITAVAHELAERARVRVAVA